MSSSAVIFIIFLILFLLIIILVNHGKSNSLERQGIIFREKCLAKCFKENNEYSTKYGILTKAILWKQNDDIASIRIFENAEIIIIEDKPYKFSDIIGFEYSDNSNILAANSVTKSSTSSVIGRAIVGGALIGGIGAIVGGVTANTKTVNETLHPSYFITITLNSLSHPQISLKFRYLQNNFFKIIDEKTWTSLSNNYDTDLKVGTSEIVSILTIIVERNKSNRNQIF